MPPGVTLIKGADVSVASGIVVEVAVGSGGGVGVSGIGVFVGGSTVVGAMVGVAVAAGSGVFVSVGGGAVFVGGVNGVDEGRIGVGELYTAVAVGGIMDVGMLVEVCTGGIYVGVKWGTGVLDGGIGGTFGTYKRCPTLILDETKQLRLINSCQGIP